MHSKVVMRKDINENRKYLIIGFISIIFLVILIKLFAIQVINKSYKTDAANNSIKEKVIYPGRGLFYDRNNNLVVCNEAVYDLLVTPNMISKKFDTTGFCKLVGVEKDVFIEKLQKCKKYSRYKSSVLFSQISKEDMGAIEEALYKYDGIEVQPRTVRKYPYSVGAHMLGDVGEVSDRFLKSHPEYKMGDYTGLSGLEKTYESYLKGEKGSKYILVDVHNVEKGHYESGQQDVAAQQGFDLILEMDINLQVYGEQLMQGKKGSVVAIDPKTGGILAMVSAPSYDPNLLVGRERSKNYYLLAHDSVNVPLLNRAIMGEYPPGSSFKIFNGLYGLQVGTITPNTKYYCAGPEAKPIKCTHHHESPLAVVSAIRESCNPFFRSTFENTINSFSSPSVGLDDWAQTAKSFGFGTSFNSDISNAKNGLIPDSKYYDNIYKNKQWKSSTIRSLSIGQGEILVTPLQLANFAAAVANEGYYIDPHFVRYIITPEDTIAPYQNSIHQTKVDKKYFKYIKEGMHEVTLSGTARIYGQIEGIDICGKTGTVQNAGRNHAIFIAFAPMEDPEIAIAVVVENSGYGSVYAVPVASLMIEYYLKGEVTRTRVEKMVLETKLIQ